MASKKFVEKGPQQRVILVTGASSGIGKESVKWLLRRGHVVYGAARRLDAMEDIKALGARVLYMDLTQDTTLAEGVRTILSETGRIDVLVNNAGYGSTGALEDVPLDEARNQFAVNVFGLSRLTQLVLPSMRAQGGGTIINMSSVGGRMATPLAGWYNATKYSVEALSDALRVEVRRFGIKVVLIEPGGIRTGWTAEAAAHAQRVSGATVYGGMVKRLLRTFQDFDAKLSHPAVIARLVDKAVAARRPRLRYVAGFMGRPTLWLKRWVPARWIDAFLAWQFNK
ncbi:oxidoreductase [Dinghuibacter silviterrae]|uniref:Short-subunit dehydrogenase n=1 Tax=Dinghuibacter silviterrae TaxID=1539049 RepID=A0A4R8DUG6_9BACT|nr:oxidoreductase [Dinghuibacter silviterrae]TDX02022.1 short-subunit dehydrogenase [Dinghuibacter silviterrae]